LCWLSLSLEERISPARRIAGIRNHKSGVNIFRESNIIRATMAPDPTEWSEIFQPKFIIVTINESKAVA